MSRKRAARGLYYGWWLAVALGVTETVSFGILYYAFGVFVAPMERELGWSRGEMAGALSVALVVSGLASVPVGRWLDRHGPRLLMSVGSCVASLLVLVWSQVADLRQFYLLWAAIGLTMAAVCYEPAFAVIAQWFERKRGRALTIVTLVGGFASTIFLPLSDWLIQLQGWRAALVSLAAILAISTIPPHTLLLRRRPEDMGLQVDGMSDRGPRGKGSSVSGVSLGAALRDGSFGWLGIGFSLHGLASIWAVTHLVPFLLDHGQDPRLAAVLAGLVGATQVFGRLLLGPLMDRFPIRATAGLALGLQPLALAIPLLSDETLAILAFVALFGASRGATTLIRPAYVAELYGRAQYASIAGALAFPVTIACAIAPVTVGAAYDLAGRYEPVMWVLVAISIVAAWAIAVPRQRRPEPLPAPAHESGAEPAR